MATTPSGTASFKDSASLLNLPAPELIRRFCESFESLADPSPTVFPSLRAFETTAAQKSYHLDRSSVRRSLPEDVVTAIPSNAT